MGRILLLKGRGDILAQVHGSGSASGGEELVYIVDHRLSCETKLANF